MCRFFLSASQHDSLEEEIAALKATTLERAIEHACVSVTAAAEGIDKACMDYLMDRATAVKLIADDFANWVSKWVLFLIFLVRS